ncbi:MAG: hypothetical protein EOO01_41195 [Chitinophagaceae bacterium]|nr:MAG: hypothetical protein EOO01_41195 [Chitinophagaceae bacterium]
MTFPISYHLQDGTRVEVSPNKTGDRYIFDLFHNSVMFDSFTWTPDANLRSADIGVTDTKSLESRYAEAITYFRNGQ